MSMSKRCKRISNYGRRAIKKHCREVSFRCLTEAKPTDDYERLYGEYKVIESVAMTLHCIYQQNPTEKMYEDAQLKAQGDAIIMGMSFELEELGIIGTETDDYIKIPTVVAACHVKIDSLRYTIAEVTMTSFLEGYPLMYSMSLKLDETPNEVAESMSLYGSSVQPPW